jgi:hypothetical protein
MSQQPLFAFLPFIGRAVRAVNIVMAVLLLASLFPVFWDA